MKRSRAEKVQGSPSYTTSSISSTFQLGPVVERKRQVCTREANSRLFQNTSESIMLTMNERGVKRGQRQAD
jgi:hypothetical protein